MNTENKQKLCRYIMKLTKTDRYMWDIMGQLSNYPTCDIIWFILLARFRAIKRLDDLITAFLPNKKPGHIACPFCKLKNFILKKKPRYYTCKTCGWVQLGKKKCACCLLPKKLRKLIGN